MKATSKNIKPITKADQVLESIIRFNQSEDKLSNYCNLHGSYPKGFVICPSCDHE